MTPRIFVQLGKGMTEREIVARLVWSFADRLEEPVHVVPPVRFLAAGEQWPFRGILET